ncbi:MAG: hypothetical protein AAFO75_06120 [Pseudomonadota bacterium]
MTTNIQSNPWSEALGVMMQKDANRRFLMSLERRSDAVEQIPDGALITTIHNLLSDQPRTN